jgi:hypothetical protein
MADKRTLSDSLEMCARVFGLDRTTRYEPQSRLAVRGINGGNSVARGRTGILNSVFMQPISSERRRTAPVYFAWLHNRPQAQRIQDYECSDKACS